MVAYARICNGIVQEYPVAIAPGFTLAQCYHPEYVASCAAVPDGVTPDVGWTATQNGSTWTFAAPVAPVLTLAQQAAAQYAEIIASGLTVTSQTGGLMGVFGISSIPNAAGDSNTSEINAEVAFINNFGEFTNGTASGLVWPLLNGQTTTFSSTGQFLAFAKASAQYVAACKLAAASLAAGQTPTWPNANIEIP